MEVRYDVTKGSSIKDVRKEGEGGQGKRDTCGHRREGVKQEWTPTKKF